MAHARGCRYPVRGGASGGWGPRIQRGVTGVNRKLEATVRAAPSLEAVS
jgi:hypothetical protein